MNLSIVQYQQFDSWKWEKNGGKKHYLCITGKHARGCHKIKQPIIKNTFLASFC